LQGAQFGIPGVKNPPPPDRELTDRESVSVGNIAFRVIHTPGHCPGHVCLYDEKAGVLFAGVPGPQLF
jgi:glyoxylase-like metal-dependent hydrolase (beta-lactamase superfamily II)